MAIEILADLTEIEPSSPEWLEIRKGGIGGSDAAAACGIGRTPYQLWADKVNPSTEDTLGHLEYIRWGKILEPVVRDEFSERTGIQVHPFPRMVRNTDHPVMLANVDGLTGPVAALDGVYEGKTTRFPDQWIKNDDGSVNVPLRYMIQGMHYLAVLGLEVVHYACLIGGQELRIAEVTRNENLIADLIEIEEAFWQSVVNREPPPVGPGDVDTLKKRWQPEAGKSVELTGTFATSLKVRAGYKANIGDNEAAIAAIDAELMAFMGDAEEATWKGKTAITWKSSTRSYPDWDRIAEIAHRSADDAKAAFSTVSTSRRFLPKEIDQ